MLIHPAPAQWLLSSVCSYRVYTTRKTRHVSDLARTVRLNHSHSLKRCNSRSCDLDEVCPLSTHRPGTKTHILLSSSVESIIIIIASCIPTLGPIYEMIRGKRSWGSRARYDGQLRSYTMDRPSKRSNISRGDGNDILMTTNIERSGSQESILNSDELQKDVHVLGKIHRTDQVKIEYGTREQSPQAQPGW